MKTLLTLIIVTVLSACSTVAGVGQDIKSSAEWTKEKLGNKL